MSEFHHPHDRFIREIFQNRENAISFFESILPSELLPLLDLRLLELTESSYISENLKEQQTDLLFKVPLKSGKESQVYILFEHKSYWDPGLYIQLLGYLSEIYRNQYRNEAKFDIVIPFVFYQGPNIKEFRNRFSDQFDLKEKEPLRRFIPDFQIELFFLSKINVQKVFKTAILKFTIGIAQAIRSGDKEFTRDFMDLYEILDGLNDEAKRLEILRKTLLYIYYTREGGLQNLQAAIANRNSVGRETLAMTIAEQLKAEGREEGKALGKLEDARKMLEEGIQLEIILRVTGFTEQELQDHGVLS